MSAPPSIGAPIMVVAYEWESFAEWGEKGTLALESFQTF